MTVAAVMAASTTTAVTAVMTAKTAPAKKWVYLMSHQIFAVIHEIHGFVYMMGKGRLQQQQQWQ